MITAAEFRKVALSFPDASEQPHFERASFRAGKKIFATLDEKSKLACVKLSEVDQNVFSSYDSAAIYPVTNKWGKQGWTNIELAKVRKDMLKDALAASYCNVAPKKLAEQVRGEGK